MTDRLMKSGAVRAFWAATGRVAGVSGLLEQAVNRRAGRGRGEAVAFIAGLVMAGLVLSPLGRPSPPVNRSLTALVVAGLLVGFGTRLARGCTSGHGVCGVSRLSPRSIAATAIFMLTGAITVWAVGSFASVVTP